MNDSITVTIGQSVDAPIAFVWEIWSRPEHIVNWCFAVESWHAPKAENDLRTGGKFSTTMAAKDGSMSFDFAGEYTLVEPYSRIEYTLGDNRTVSLMLSSEQGRTILSQSFQTEPTHSQEQQRDGWLAILTNFKLYAEEKFKEIPAAPHPIYTCLWFDNNALQAAEYYCSIIKDSEILSVNPMVVMFKIKNQHFMGLNGGPQFPHSEAVSFVLECDTQEEIDHFWEAFSREGTEQMCGWVKDKYGISWQIIPKILGELMSDPERSQRVVAAFLPMKKFDIQTILDA